MVEVKDRISDFANGLFKLFNFGRFKTALFEFISKKYNKGIDELEREINANVVIDFQTKQRKVEQLSQYTDGLIKGVGDDMEKSLRAEIQRGIMAGESRKEIQKRIAQVLRGNNPTRFRFQDRVKMIFRTESTRIENMAKVEEGKATGIPLVKYVRNPNPQADVCKRMIAKYSKDNAIPLERDFWVRVNGKSIKEPYPPFHPNCKTQVIISRKKEEE